MKKKELTILILYILQNKHTIYSVGHHYQWFRGVLPCPVASLSSTLTTRSHSAARRGGAVPPNIQCPALLSVKVTMP